MKRYFLFACSFALVLLFENNPGISKALDDTLQLPTGTMVLSAPQDFKAKKSQVVFSHSTHFKFSCKSCHHTWDRESEIQGCSTEGCHETFWPTMTGKKTGKDEKTISMTAAYHRVCRDCHRAEGQKIKQMKAKDVVKGPVACDGCHPKNLKPGKAALKEMSVPRGIITIDAPEDAETKRSSVEFPHGTHFSYACTQCHHTWDGESEIQNCTTSGCHDQAEPDESTRDINDPKNSSYYLAAYHRACLKCHRDLKNQGKEMIKSGVSDESKLPGYGPVACTGCHQ